jgi:hypothetical protein
MHPFLVIYLNYSTYYNYAEEIKLDHMKIKVFKCNPFARHLRRIMNKLKGRVDAI